MPRRHCGEELRPRLPRAGEGQLCRRAETWHSSSPRRLLREPRRTELLSAGSSSLRREVLAGDCWKTSSGSSSSSTMEGRGFSGAAPLSGRGCGQGGGQDWSQAQPPLPRPPPSPRQGTNLWRLRQPRGPGVAAEPLRGEQTVPAQQQEGAPAQLHRDQSWACRPPASQCPPGQPRLPQPHTSAAVPASTTPHPLSFLCCCHVNDELPNLSLSILSRSRGCTPNPSPGSAIRAPALSGACSQLGRVMQVQNVVHTPGILHSCFVYTPPVFVTWWVLVGLFGI